jgi:hypothetical protein
MQLGRQPDIRLKIETALVAYEKGEATPETKAMFRDWSVMVMATLAQAIRFEMKHEVRPEEDPAVVNTWFKVLRVRAQQNSVEAKLAKQRQRQLESQPQIAAAAVAETVTSRRQSRARARQRNGGHHGGARLRSRAVSTPD